MLTEVQSALRSTHYGVAVKTTKERVAELVGSGLSVRETAAVLNVTTQAVYKHMKALGIDPPTSRTGDAA